MAIAITLSNSTVAADAQPGLNLVGMFNVDGVRLQPNGNPNGWFLIAGRMLFTTWMGQAIPGQYPIQVRSPGGGPVSFIITITAPATAPPPPPPPPVTTLSVTLNGSNSPVTVAGGATIAATVAGGPGNPGDWLGVFASSVASGGATLGSWRWLSTDTSSASPPPTGATSGTVHLAVPVLPGQYEARFFPNNGWTSTAKGPLITVQAVAPPPPPPPPTTIPTPLITLTQSAPEIPDSTPKGTVVATYVVTMSDGSPFTGPVAFVAPNFDSGGVFSLSPLNRNVDGSTTGQIIVNPAGPGVGPNLGTITDHVTLQATQ